MSVQIDAPTAFALLTDAVTEFGEDHVVTECRYVQDGVPNCIVGVALSKVLGAEALALMEDDEQGGSAMHRVNGNVIGSGPVVEFLAEQGVTLTPGALDVWNAAQDLQDAQVSWGRALEAAADKMMTVKN